MLMFKPWAGREEAGADRCSDNTDRLTRKEHNNNFAWQNLQNNILKRVEVV